MNCGKQWIVMLCFASCIAAANLLVNGSFESGLDNWEIKARQQDAFTAPELEYQDLPGPGRTALRWRLEKDKNVTISSLPFAFPEDSRNFRISFKYKCIDFTVSYIQPHISLLCPPGLTLPGKSSTIWSCSVNSRLGNINTPWQTWEENFSIPDGRNFRGVFRLSCARNAIGTILIDDIQISAAPAPQKQEAVSAVETALEKQSKSGVNMLADWKLSPAISAGQFQIQLPSKGKWSANHLLYEVRNHNLTGDFVFSFECQTQEKTNIDSQISISPFYNAGRKPEKITIPEGKPQQGWRRFEKFFSVPDKTNNLAISLSAYSAGGGEILVRNLTLEPLVQAGDSIDIWKAEPGGVNGVYLQAETPELTYYIRNQHTEDRNFSVQCIVSDYFGKECLRFAKNWNLKAQQINVCPMPISLSGKLGFFSVSLHWQEGLVPREHITSFVQVSTPPHKADPFFGMSCFNPNLPELMRRMGVGTRGVLLQWHRCTPEGLLEYDQIIADNLPHMQVVALISPQGDRKKYGKIIEQRLQQGMYPFPDEMYDESTSIAEQLATRYRGKIEHWALVEEINLTIRNRTFEKERYIRMAKLLSQALRKGNPDITLAGIGVSSGDGRSLPRFQLVRELWAELKDHLDGLGLDQYSKPPTFGPGYKPANSENSQIHEIITAAWEIIHADGKSHLSIDEKGRQLVAGLPLDSPYARSMANIITREYIVLKSVPGMKFWLYFRLMPWRSGDSTEFTMFERAQPRHAVAAYAFVARKLCGAQFIRDLSVHQQIPCRIFQRENRYVITAWLSDTEADSKASVRFDQLPDLSICDAVGNEIQIPKTGTVELSLGEAPVYLETSATLAEIEKVFSSAAASLPEVSAMLELVDQRQLRICLNNLTAVPLALQLSLKDSAFARQIKLPAGSPLDILADLPGLPATTGSHPFELSVISGGGHHYKFNDQFTLFPLKRVAGKAEVAALPPTLDMRDGPSYINNPDYIASGHWQNPKDLGAVVRVAYNQDFFFLQVEVDDDQHCNDAGSQTLWRGDAIQFAFDPFRDARKKKNLNRHGYFDDDVMISAGLTDKGPVLFYENSPKKEFHKKTFPADVRRDEDNLKTYYSLQIPWAAFPDHFPPVSGKVFGFGICVLDRDRSNAIAEYWLQSSPGIAGGLEPALLHGLTVE